MWGFPVFAVLCIGRLGMRPLAAAAAATGAAM